MKKRINRSGWVCLLTLAMANGALYADTPTTGQATTKPAPQQADVAAPKVGKNGLRFMQMHESFLKRAKAGKIDYLHPNAKGCQIWADAMRPLLDELMK